MGANVLRPQDVFAGILGGGVHTASGILTNKSRSYNGNVSDLRPKDESSNAGVPIMGKVALLRRCHSLSFVPEYNGAKTNTPIGKSFDDLKSGSPPVVLNQVRTAGSQSADIYAGSAFFASPSPRSVPLPTFFSKIESTPWHVGGTKMLRRLLGLD